MDQIQTLSADATQELKMSYTGPDGGLHYWLLVDGVPLAYSKVYERTGPEGTVVELCDIETRAGHRHRGHATNLLRIIAEGYGVDRVSHRGSYTEDGFSFIAPKLKRIGEAATGPTHRPMSFVADWDLYGMRYC